mmetsp:Transcript_15655/g.49161  ORF Transcript_15655/g.49161 Transcript_15655/m.49161 type:complete len:607 (+) Transcript_15655:490-2310(+)
MHGRPEQQDAVAVAEGDVGEKIQAEHPRVRLVVRRRAVGARGPLPAGPDERLGKLLQRLGLKELRIGEDLIDPAALDRPHGALDCLHLGLRGRLCFPLGVAEPKEAREHGTAASPLREGALGQRQRLLCLSVRIVLRARDLVRQQLELVEAEDAVEDVPPPQTNVVSVLVRDREGGHRRHPGLVVVSKGHRGARGGGVEQRGEFAEAHHEVVHHILKAVASRDLGHGNESVDGLPQHLVILGVVEHHTDGRDGRPPDDAEHLPVERRLVAPAAHQPLPLHSALDELHPPAAGHLPPVPAPALELDLVLVDTIEDGLEHFARKVLLVVDAAHVLNERRLVHAPLDLLVVLVRVEHQDAVGEHAGGVLVLHAAAFPALLHELPREVVRHTLDLLGLSRDHERFQVGAERHLEVHAFEVEGGGVLFQHLHVEGLVLPEVLPDQTLVEARCVAQELRHRLGGHVRGPSAREKVNLPHELQPLLDVAVEVVRRHREPALVKLAAAEVGRPCGQVPWGLALLIPEVGVLLRVHQLLRLGGVPAARAAIGDGVNHGQEPLEAEQVHGAEGGVDWEGVLAEEVAELLEHIGGLDRAVKIGVHVHHKSGLAAKVH